MNPEIKKKWVDALRSGEYDQTSGTLRRIGENGKDSFCCLGVLCDVATKEGLELNTGTDGNYYKYDGATSTLPTSVIDWAEMRSHGDDTFNYGNNPVVTDIEFGRSSLAEFNDGGRTFEEMADIIERNL